MDHKETLKALEGHPQALEILEVLKAPVDPREAYDWREGYVVDAPFSVDHESTCEGIETVHRLSGWKGGWNPEEHRNRDTRAKKKRALHGLEFMNKPHRNGRYEKNTPSNRRKVLKAYMEQHTGEWAQRPEEA